MDRGMDLIRSVSLDVQQAENDSGGPRRAAPPKSKINRKNQYAALSFMAEGAMAMDYGSTSASSARKPGFSVL
jgi:hypothetical protein